jgi:hypothetical protein
MSAGAMKATETMNTQTRLFLVEEDSATEKFAALM